MQRFDLKYFNPQYYLDLPCKFRQFDEIASRTVCGVQKAGQPDALCAPKLSAVAKPGLRGVQKAREPGSCPTSYPALRMPLALLMQPRVAYHLENKSRKEIAVAVAPTSDNSTRQSRPEPSKNWCSVCGEDMPTTQVGRPLKHCSLACVEWEISDARKNHDHGRASRLYTLRAWWRRRLGVRV